MATIITVHMIIRSGVEPAPILVNADQITRVTPYRDNTQIFFSKEDMIGVTESVQDIESLIVSAQHLKKR